MDLSQTLVNVGHQLDFPKYFPSPKIRAITLFPSIWAWDYALRYIMTLNVERGLFQDFMLSIIGAYELSEIKKIVKTLIIKWRREIEDNKSPLE